MKNKKDVYVIVDTPKKAKKLKKVLNMFGEEFSTTDGNAIKTGSYKGSAELYAEFNKAYFTGHNWTLMPTCSEKSEVSIKELRNILAREHLKEGDVVIAGINVVNNKWVVKLKSFVNDNLTGEYNCLERPFKAGDIIGCFDNFIRYATEAEKELLRINSLKEQAKEVIKPVKDTLKDGWYKHESFGKFLVFIENIDSDNESRYGFNVHGYWFNKKQGSGVDLNDYRRATHEEVEKALIKEAKNRGYTYSEYNYNTEENELCGINNWRLESVFCDGHWEQPTDKFAELKEAHKNGAVIQYQSKVDWKWVDCYDAIYWDHNYEYRIKPEEKPQVGDLVKAWDNYESDFVIGKILNIGVDREIYPYKVSTAFFKNAKKITPQEAKELLTDYCR